MAVYFDNSQQASGGARPSLKARPSSAVAIVDPETKVALEVPRPKEEEGERETAPSGSTASSLLPNGTSVWKECSNIIPQSPDTGSFGSSVGHPSPFGDTGAHNYDTPNNDGGIRSGSALRGLSGGLDVFVRRVTGVLNKFTPEKYDRLFEGLLRLLTVEVKSTTATMKDVLMRVTPLIFEKALSEPTFAGVYAELCQSLHNHLDEVDVESGEGEDEPVIKTSKQRFQAILLNLCQKEHSATIPDDPLLESGEREAAVSRARRRRLGNITFIAELFKRKIMPEPLIHLVVQKLLHMSQKDCDPCEEDIEIVCKLMETAGRRMDRAAAQSFMNKYFARLKKLSLKHPSSRMRFLIMNVLDMRDKGWPPARHASQPRKLAACGLPARQGSASSLCDPCSPSDSPSTPVLRTSYSSGTLQTRTFRRLQHDDAAAKTVYVAGIDTGLKEGALDAFLEEHGTVIKRRLCGDTHHPTQYGFFEFETPAAAHSLRQMDKTYLGKYQIHCSMARTPITDAPFHVPTATHDHPRQPLQRTSSAPFIAAGARTATRDLLHAVMARPREKDKNVQEEEEEVVEKRKVESAGEKEKTTKSETEKEIEGECEKSGAKDAEVTEATLEKEKESPTEYSENELQPEKKTSVNMAQTGLFVARGPRPVLLDSQHELGVLSVEQCGSIGKRLLQEVAGGVVTVEEALAEWVTWEASSQSGVLQKQLLHCCSMQKYSDERRVMVEILEHVVRLGQQGSDVVRAALKEFATNVTETELWLDVPSLWRNVATVLLDSHAAGSLGCEDLCTAVAPFLETNERDAFIAAAEAHTQTAPDNYLPVSTMLAKLL